MAVAIAKTAFVAGEVSPKLYGHTDLARLQAAATTMRNMFVGFEGGAYSRAGTRFCGYSKQTGRSYPPRMIPFQFSISQGLALEFGNFYMRVLFNGEFVVDETVNITGATKANPCVITANATGASSATAVNDDVVQTYSPGDKITLAGGVFTQATVLSVTNTALKSLAINSPGSDTVSGTVSGYAPGDTIALDGGTQTTDAQLTVATTQVLAATVRAGGSGGANGSAVVTGTSGTGTQAQFNVTISGGAITSVDSIVTGGAYTANPGALAGLTVSGAGLSGAILNVVMGVATISVSNGGVFTANPLNGIFTQASTSGSGVDASFQNALMAPNAVTVSTAGAYTTYPTNPVAQASTTGFGVGAQFDVTTESSESFNTGDWTQISGVEGMTELNGKTVVLTQLTSTTYALYDIFGNAIDSTNFGTYTSGGFASRIYTIETIYAEADLPYLKFIESADAMTICCVNQDSVTEYLPQTLTRNADDDWTFAPIVPATTVDAPTGLTATASGTGSTDYQYEVTAVAEDGSESVASNIASATDAVDIAATAGTISLSWSPVSGVSQYNIYKASPGYETPPPSGSLFGYAGSAYGVQFIDSNIVADFAQVPPIHDNPFARGQITSAPVANGGANYTTATVDIHTSTGSGAQIIAVLESNAVVATIVQSSGQDYAPGDYATVSGDGSGAEIKLKIGPQTGTYPSCPGFFQERNVLANSLNNPDTYWMSQPGAFKNFDFRIPTIASDAITGSPWSQQVNGIQALIQTAGGLLVLTGLQAWILVGQGSFATNVSAISPSSQVANQQPAIGCAATIPPIKINYDVIYVNSKQSIYLDLPYQLYALSEPIDLTENSSHLFLNFTIREHAWCETPYKVIWAARNDGVMLSLTYYKTQQVAGWGRHDTQGLFQSVCSVTEPPIDALYLAVQRFINGVSSYMIERMDNRLWQDAESCWCVDAALQLEQPTPDATLTASSASGLGSITGATGLIGGQNYSSATIASVVDDNGEGPGTGAVPTLTITAGVITAVTFADGQQGSGYVRPKLVIRDPAGSAGGSGASATLTLNNAMTFTASSGVFTADSVGSVIRMGGGKAVITGYTSATVVDANMQRPISQVLGAPDGTVTPLPAASGAWTMTAPTSSITGLDHLIGASVTGLADGDVISPRTVDANGAITLDAPASAVVVGLGFTAQLQSVYLDAGEEPTIQGQRKKVAAVTVRVESSRDVTVGANQVDGATLNPIQVAPPWYDLQAVANQQPQPYNDTTVPLYTGDSRVMVPGGFGTRGQVCAQQTSPLPMSILSWVPEMLPGDDPDLKARPQGRG